MATLKRYEIDAVVSEIYEELEKKLPKFDDSKLKDSKEFKELLKLEKEQEKLEIKIESIKEVIENITDSYLGKDRYRSRYNVGSEVIISELKNDFNKENLVNKSTIERTVILNSGKDLEDIVKLVIKKLSK